MGQSSRDLSRAGGYIGQAGSSPQMSYDRDIYAACAADIILEEGGRVSYSQSSQGPTPVRGQNQAESVHVPISVCFGVQPSVLRRMAISTPHITCRASLVPLT